MPVNLFPVKGFVLSGCVAIALQGCASTQPALEPTVETLVNPSTGTGYLVSKCIATQRNLKVAWELRQYWCGGKERLARLQNINDTVMNSVSSQDTLLEESSTDELKSQKYRSLSVAPIVDSLPVPETVTPSLTREDALKKLKKDYGLQNKDTVPETQSGSSAEIKTSPQECTARKLDKSSVSNNSIIFARNRYTLGPKGRTATHALIDQVTDSNQVLIRGIIQTDEILVNSKIYREKVSVARALAVRKYWTDQGVDTSHITILHHNPDVSGRAVEVQFRG
jgi:outer membrane protein OmpA-like peptidoglycan-associated protein